MAAMLLGLRLSNLLFIIQSRKINHHGKLHRRAPRVQMMKFTFYKVINPSQSPIQRLMAKFESTGSVNNQLTP